MPPTATAPSAAERVQSACTHAGQAVLALSGADPAPVSVHHVRRCGDVVLAVPRDCAAVRTAALHRAGAPAVLELADHAPVTLREPVRALVWLRGWVRTVPGRAERMLVNAVAEEHPHPALLDIGHTTTLLRLVLDTAVIADSTGADSVTVEDLRRAEPDPFREMEADWLRHLEADHPDLVAQLARHLPARLQYGRIHPLALDRYGLTLRIEGVDGDHDFRLPFTTPADDLESLGRAVRLLAGCPFLNGLRKNGLRKR